MHLLAKLMLFVLMLSLALSATAKGTVIIDNSKYSIDYQSTPGSLSSDYGIDTHNDRDGAYISIWAHDGYSGEEMQCIVSNKENNYKKIAAAVAKFGPGKILLGSFLGSACSNAGIHAYQGQGSF